MREAKQEVVVACVQLTSKLVAKDLSNVVHVDVDLIWVGMTLVDASEPVP